MCGGFIISDTKRKIWVTNPMDNAYTADASMQSLYNSIVYSGNYSQEEGRRLFWANPGRFEQEYQWWLNQYVNARSTKNWTTSTVDKVSVGVLYNVERAHDFYANAFGHIGTDGNGKMALVVNPIARDKQGNPVGSCASSFGNMLQFGYENRKYGAVCYDATAVDCVIHEYTHRVTESFAHWSLCGQLGETAAVNEGYSDIMGEMGESATDWRVGASICTNNGCIRDLTYCGGTKKGNNYYKYTNKAEMQYVECHDGSTIISHAAYLMHKYQIPKFLIAEIWFASMQRLPKGPDNCTFADVRNAVHIAADPTIGKYYSGNMKMNYMAKVLMAFNAVNIKSPTYKMGDANMDGYVNRTDINYINQYYRGDRTLDWFAITLSDVNYDGKVTSEDSDVIARALSRGTQNNL